MRLEGKVALVTGGAGGIGRGIVKRLAEEGAAVAVADIDRSAAQKVVEEVEELGWRAIALGVDVTRWDQVRAMVAQTVDRLGGLHIAVNNAGVQSIAPVEELTEKDWDLVHSVNAKGIFLCCKAELPPMKRQGWGRIINTASIAGKEGVAELAHYCASKFAAVGFTNALAKEVARKGITVNAICPGIVRTPMWCGPDGLAARRRRPGETLKESWERNQDELIPQGEAQTPEDMGDLVVYFVLAEHVTGQAFNVDGGYTWH